LASSTIPEFVIQTEGLTKRFGAVTAVNDLALSVPRGGVFGLLGPNGSGKTTTLAMLLGLVRPTCGSMRLFGEDARASHRLALRRMGAIVDGPYFYPGLTGRDNLRCFQAIGRRGAPGEIDELLELVGLSQRADSPYHTYSLGMRQRLGIACALLGDPELLFLDEPTNGLDPAGMVDVRNLILRLSTDGRTVLLCSHLLHEVEQVCDRVAILSNGHQVATGEVHTLLAQQDRLQLRTTDDARAERILQGVPWIVGVDRAEDALLVQVPPERAGELTRLLAQQEVYVTEMRALQRSLEGFYLDATARQDAPVEEASM